jgi:hypothetical protein
LQIAHTRDIESECQNRRELESEVDKLKFKIQCKEDETTREITRNEEIGHEMEKLRESL